ncbi:MAG: hypothetical protein J6X55_04475, partial [Victivallales bacterium]|nr:hypothetical protein [Victivallales bacterium]
WRHWNAETVEKDMALFEQHGISLLRVFPLWSDFQPIHLLQYGSSSEGQIDREVCLGEDELPLPDTFAGRAGMDENMLEHFRELCDMAERHHIQLIVAIMTVHMTGRHYVPRAIENRDLFSDPFALKWEMKFYDCFVRTFKDHPAIAAWETGNEMNYTAPVKSADHAWVWTKMMHDVIRLADSSRPIVGVMAEGLDPMKAKWLIFDQGELSDYASVHRYDILNEAASDGFLHVRNLYRAAAECRIISDIGGKPCFTEETGNWRNIALSLEGMGRTLNAMLWNAWVEDCRAFLWWCAFDQAHLNFAPYHWGDWPGLEHGVFTAERKAHPAGLQMARFIKMLEESPVKELPCMKPDAVCVTNDLETAFSTYLLARQAGLNLKFQAAKATLLDSDVYFLPSLSERGGISLEDWRKLCENVANGAVCYLSADDCNLPNLKEFCGMEIVRRRKAMSPLNCCLDDNPLTLNCGLEKVIQVENADVLLSDDKGNPLLLRNRLGKGTVYTLTFALEKILSNTARGYDSPWWRVYKKILDKKLLLSVSDCEVIVTEHFYDSLNVAIAVVNCSEQEKNMIPEIVSEWEVKSVYGDGKYENGVLNLPPCGGAIFICQKLYSHEGQ